MTTNNIVRLPARDACALTMTRTVTQPIRALPPGTIVIKTPESLHPDAIAVLLGSVAFALNVMQMDDGQDFVNYDDISLSSIIFAARIMPRLSSWEQSRVAEYVRLRIEEGLTKGGFALLHHDLGEYAPNCDWRRRKELEGIVDEIIASKGPAQKPKAEFWAFAT